MKEIRYSVRARLDWTTSQGERIEVVTGYSQPYRQRRAIRAAAVEAMDRGGQVHACELVVGTQLVVVEKVEYVPGRTVQLIGEMTVDELDAALERLRKERNGGG